MRLTSDQLFALAGRVRAAESARDRPTARRPPDWRRDLDGTCEHVVELWRAVGIDADILGTLLYRGLVQVGVAEPAVRPAVERATGWCPRTRQERTEAVVRGMLADGLSAPVVRRVAKALFEGAAA